MTKKIALNIHNVKLKQLLEAYLGARSCQIDEEGDVVLTDDFTFESEKPILLFAHKSGQKLKNNKVLIPLPVRLGQVKDQMDYLYSRRFQHHLLEDQIFEHQGFYLDLAQSVLRFAADEIRLTDKEKMMLACLWRAPDFRLSRQDLLDQVWGFASTVETHTLETHIYRLRQKIEESFVRNDFIVNEESVYKLNF
jgi:hypothetical protein